MQRSSDLSGYFAALQQKCLAIRRAVPILRFMLHCNMRLQTNLILEK
jgi:hypothetical protein